MFYIIAGKFNPPNDDFPVKTLITKDKFADKYARDCTNLLDQQDIFKIIDKIERGRQSAFEGFSRIVYELERAIRSEFGYVHVYPSKPTYSHPYVSADGDVVLHGELNMNIQIKGIKSDNLMAKIEQVVAAAIEHSANEEYNVEYEVIF